MKTTLKLTLTVLLIAALATLGCTKKSRGTAILPQGDSFRIDAGPLAKGQVSKYSYHFKDKDITFLVARASNGDIKTTFDACVSCYVNKLGYKQKGDCVVCVYCDNTFKIDDMDAGLGSCYPVKIDHTLEGNTVAIGLKTVEDGEKYF